MRKRNTNHGGKKSGLMAADLLRRERGAMSRIARRLHVHPSLVSRVARHEKTSERVARAIAAFLSMRAREFDTAAFLIDHKLR